MKDGTSVTITGFSIELMDNGLVQLTLGALGSGQSPDWPRGEQRTLHLVMEKDQAAYMGTALSQSVVDAQSSVH